MNARNSVKCKSFCHLIGERSYELTNHLGNVLSVISDKVIPHPSGGSVAYYKADIMQAMDYSPFGVTLKGRNFKKIGAQDKFRFGFQGQEEDDELKGDGNSVNYKYRMHDPRLGRFFAIDPLSASYPGNSPYAFSENNVIHCIELEGLEKVPANEIWNKKGSTTVSVSASDIQYDGYMKYGKIHGDNVLLMPIVNGPNKGNWAAYTLGEGTTIKEFYKVFVQGKVVPNFDAPLKYVVGKSRVKNKAHVGDMGEVAAGNLYEASKSGYEMSTELMDVQFHNEYATGSYSYTTGEFESGSLDDIMDRVYDDCIDQLTNPMNYLPGPEIKLKVKLDIPSSPANWNQFLKQTKGKYNSASSGQRSVDYNKWLKNEFEAGATPIDTPNPAEKKDEN